MTIVDSTVSGNDAAGPFLTVAGGGISNSGTLALFRCTVSGNRATQFVAPASAGGGIATTGSSVTTLIDCTVAGNSAVTGGGVQVLGGSLALTNCTVAQNVGGGLALSGGAPAVGMQNAIVAQNQSGPDVSGAVASGGDNLIGNPAGATGLLPGDRTNIDPLLGPLQNNGGPTQTMALLPTSPAIDAGNNAAPGLPATDQRGLNRVVNNVVDIGAFEYQPPGTTRALTAAPNPSVLGRLVTLTATVTGAAPGSNVPTGFVTFSCRGVTLGTADLSGGSATLTTAGLPLGEDLVSAVYSGDADFTGFQSAAATVLVGPPPPATAGVFDPATATWYLRSGNSAGPPDAGLFRYGPAGSIPVTGDWTGAGGGIGVFDPATFTWYLRGEASAGSPDAGVFQYGGVGWLPVTGDWGNSGHTGIGAFDPSTATWYLRSEPSAGPPDAGQFRYGVAGGVPVVGDWTGTGHLGIGVFDPATFTWYLRSTATAGPPDVGTFRYGGIGFLAVAGDWTGAGHAGIGVIDPETGVWYLHSQPGAGPPDAGAFAYGGPGWLPVCGPFAAPQSLLAAGGQGAGAAVLTEAELQAAVAGALARLSAAGADPALVAALASARYGVGALPPGVLGLADAAARRVTLSADAAGHGWFADGTPLQDEEFAPGSPLVALPGSPAAGKEDLLSAVLHEMGHLAGRPDGDTGLMAGSLAAGTRDLGALDSVFARQAL
jgi:hypothetical protein